MTVAPPAGAPAGLRTGSLRLRLTVAVIAVLGVTLIVLGLAVDTAFGIQSTRNVDALLTGRVQLARQLARAEVGPQQIVNRVQADGVQAQLRLRTGEILGTVVPPGQRSVTRTATLTGPAKINNARLTLTVDTSLASDARRTLRRVLLLTGALALLLGAIVITVVVRLALRPVTAMGQLAQGIASGGRGGRLAPTRSDTDLGRTAQAFDEMLDELEGAETRARAAEARTRAFLADAAHELRTPITGVRAGAEALLQHGDQLDPEQRQRLEALLIAEAHRAGRLINDLLAAARLDAGLELELEPTSLPALVRQEVERAHALQPGTMINSGGADVELAADAERVGAILRNVIDNALRAVRPAGRISIRIGVDQHWAYVDVTDDGPGVAPADRERIFERLVRLDAARSADSGGSGLGLAIARGYARAHGGDLVHLATDLDGAPRLERVGATFRLTLPRRDPGRQP